MEGGGEMGAFRIPSIRCSRHTAGFDRPEDRRRRGSHGSRAAPAEQAPDTLETDMAWWGKELMIDTRCFVNSTLDFY